MPKISDTKLKSFYTNKKNSCKSRKIEFLLTKEQCRELLSIEQCAYTGVVMTLTNNKVQKPTDVTLERVDCTKPYTLENTIAVCKAANGAKSAFEAVYREEAGVMLCKMADSLKRIEAAQQPIKTIAVVKKDYTFVQKMVKWAADKVGV